MQRAAQNLIAILLLLTALWPCGGLAADEPSVATAAATAREERLALQGLLAWQRLNEARSNPRATLERLAIPVEQARVALGDDAWILDEGLPPLALNQRLHDAAALHGRDMFSRIYYSHVTPEGLGPLERIAATGYQALAEDETLGVLIFSGYVELKLAVDFMVDTMLRDELTGTPGVGRNIFSPDFTEAGIVFFAETIPLIAGEPYVYLFVMDFAKPVVPARYLLGSCDIEPGRFPAMMPFEFRQWGALQLLAPGFFQVPYPDGGAVLVMAGAGMDNVGEPVFVYDRGDAANVYVDLRAVRTPE